MGLSIGRNGNVVHIDLDDADDMDVQEMDHQLYFLYDYVDYYDCTEAENVELVVNMVLDRMTRRPMKLVVTTHDKSDNITGVYEYPCSFKTFKYDYEISDVICYGYFYGYIDLPNTSEYELKSLSDMIIYQRASVSIIYKDDLNLVIPIVDMLSGTGSDFYDRIIFNKYAFGLTQYLIDGGYTLSDLQRNFNNLELINRE